MNNLHNLTARYNNTRIEGRGQMNDQIHELLEQLPLQEQEIVAMLIRQLAERQGIEARSNDSTKPACHVTEITSFSEGLDLYRAQMDLDGISIAKFILVNAGLVATTS